MRVKASRWLKLDKKTRLLILAIAAAKNLKKMCSYKDYIPKRGVM